MAAITVLLAACAERVELGASRDAAEPRIARIGDSLRVPDAPIVARVREVMAERGYPGLAVSVRIGDSTGWSATLGFADVESASPIATDSRFAIGSISKSVSAAAVMRLADRAAVDIDQDVRRLVPRAATLQHPVTLRQLMSHQGGVRHYRVRPWYPGFSEFYWNMQVVSSDAALALFLDDGLRFEPDRDFLYSTFGYTLAASAVEAITGQTFADIVAQEVARPLGLNTLAVDAEGLALPGRTRDYRRLLGGGLATARPTNNSMRIAGAGFVASVDDLARFGIGLLDSGFISHDTRELMLTPRRLRSGEENPQRYALGWRVGQLLHPTDSTRSVRIVHHGGSAPGAESVLLVLPEQGISVAMAGNARTGGSGALLQAAADIARLFAFAP